MYAAALTRANTNGAKQEDKARSRKEDAKPLYPPVVVPEKKECKTTLKQLDAAISKFKHYSQLCCEQLKCIQDLAKQSYRQSLQVSGLPRSGSPAILYRTRNGSVKFNMRK